jgi:hypothetical protein
MKSASQDINSYFSLLTTEQKNSVISLIKSFIKSDEHVRISKKQYNREIAEAEKRVAKGEFFTEEQAEKALSKW